MPSASARIVLLLFAGAALLPACGGDDAAKTGSERAPAVEVTAVAVAAAGVSTAWPPADTAPVAAAASVVPAAPSTEATAAPAGVAPTADRPFDLAAVDWANRSYAVPCPDPAQPTPVTLLDGRAERDGFHYELGAVVRGEMGAPRHPVTVVELHCTGADSFPNSLLLFDGSSGGAVLLGYPASPASATADQAGHRWEAQGVPEIVDGTLLVPGVAYRAGVPECCADLTVLSRIVLEPDLSLLEVDRVETPRGG